MKYTMLIVSRYCAFDDARYAGSKIHNYYLKRFHNDFDIKLITMADPADASKLDFYTYGIDADVTFVDERPRHALFFLIYNWKNIPNYFGKTLGLVNGFIHRIMLKKAKQLKQQGYYPDIVVLEWTQTLLAADAFRQLFPKALFIGIEHDVAFLRLSRQYAAAGGFNKIKELLRYLSLRKKELGSLELLDMVVPLNNKDRGVLIENGVASEIIHVIAPYFMNYNDVTYNPDSRTILFFGAMDRPENYKSIIWFIDRVFTPYLTDSFNLCIAGSKPHESLFSYASEKIKITGFIPDIRSCFGSCVCKVVPLLQGGGIKVKVLEAMSTGIPVLANTIAIEGIPAQNGIHYLHCETPEDYISAFKQITDRCIDLSALSRNAKQLITENFNPDASYTAYRKAILSKISRH